MTRGGKRPGAGRKRSGNVVYEIRVSAALKKRLQEIGAKRVREALAKLAEEGEPMWKPIDTAPKDGTQILICMAFDADIRPIQRDIFGLFVHRAAWWGDDVGWNVYNSQPCEQPAFFEPTHWMPIPEPPS